MALLVAHLPALAAADGLPVEVSVLVAAVVAGVVGGLDGTAVGNLVVIAAVRALLVGELPVQFSQITGFLQAGHEVGLELLEPAA